MELCVTDVVLLSVVQASEKIRHVEQSHLQFATSEVCHL